MTLETSNSGKPSVRFTLPTLAALSSIIGLFVYVIGFASGYMVFKSEMAALREQQSELRAGSTMAQGTLTILSTKITVLESDIKYISQGVAELRLNAIPKR